jgi:hypothetical protein
MAIARGAVQGSMPTVWAVSNHESLQEVPPLVLSLQPSWSETSLQASQQGIPPMLPGAVSAQNRARRRGRLQIASPRPDVAAARFRRRVPRHRD